MVDPLAITLATRSIAYLVSSAIGIRELASKVKANKEQSQLLARRIVHIAQLLELLERTRALVQIPNLDQVLEDLVDTVSRAEDLIKGLADTKSWYKKLLKTGSFKNSFADINTRLSSTLALLNASVSLHQALTSAQAGAASASTEPTASEKSLFDSDAPLISYEELEEEFDQEADAAAEEVR
ncbi:hypothetical protein BC828DRAFT_275223 [Blastocladiella britannica]|nr:hypothetical protein BC828DRAFT_275223 [Blastocladiella britannica]